MATTGSRSNAVQCPVCGSTGTEGRSRCLRCGSTLTGAQDDARIAPIAATLAEHRARAAKLAGVAQTLADDASESLAALAERERREFTAAGADAEASVHQRAKREWMGRAERLRGLVASLQATAAGASWERMPEALNPPPGVPPAGIRAGTAKLVPPEGVAEPLEVPMLLPGLGRGHLLIRAGSDRRAEAVGLLESVLLRLLASMPAGHVRFRIHDPVGLGSSLSAFGSFARPRVARGAPTTDGSSLRVELDSLIELANRISGEYLRGEHASLTEFLQATGHGLVPYEVLVVVDYPTALDDDAGDRLQRLAATGASRGIMLIVHQPSESSAAALSTQTTVVEADGSGRWRCSELPGLVFRPDPRPGRSLLDATARRVPPPPPALLFKDTLSGVAPGSCSSAQGLETVIGKAGLEPVGLRLDDDVPHALVAGDTGSGKSNLLRVIVYGLAHRYEPSELQLYLLDFKEGIEFREFAVSSADPTFLPHARVVSVQSSRAFGVAVLEHLARLTSERYRALPDDAKKLSTLRTRHPEQPWPRLLLVVDEFHVLFETGDDLAHRAANALLLLGKQGRAAGVHFLLATQAIGDVAAGNAVAAQVEGIFKAARLRVALRLDDGESQQVLRLGNRAAAELHEPGMAIVNGLQGHEDGNLRTQVLLLDDGDAQRVRREALLRASNGRRPPRVFDGGGGADPGADVELRAAIAGSMPSRTAETWLGAALHLDPDDPRSYPGLKVGFTSDRHRNLAVLGAGAAEAVAILQWAALGLGANLRGGEFHLVDLMRNSDDAPRDAVRVTFQALQGLGCDVRITRETDARVLASPWRALAEARSGGPRFLILFGADRLQHMEDALDPEAEGFYPETPASILRTLIGEGPLNGTHVLGWWSTIGAMEQQIAEQAANLGMRTYLAVADEQIQLHTAGTVHCAPSAPLALWYDVARGAHPAEFQVFRPVGSDGIPDYLMASIR